MEYLPGGQHGSGRRPPRGRPFRAGAQGYAFDRQTHRPASIVQGDCQTWRSLSAWPPLRPGFVVRRLTAYGDPHGRGTRFRSAWGVRALAGPSAGCVVGDVRDAALVDPIRGQG